MNAPIDVLAVMDRFANRASYDFPALTVAELREARAAVAEAFETIDEGKRQWDQVAVSLGVNGDDADAVIARAAAVAEVVAKKNDAYFAWQMLAAICDTDPSTDRIKARDAAWNVYSAIARCGGAS